MSDYSIDEITKLIISGDFESAVEKLDETVPEKKAEVLAAVTHSLLNLRTYDIGKQLKSLSDQLLAYQASEDLTSSAFIDGILSSIVSNQSAFQAQYLYDLHWFKNLEFSFTVKTLIAQVLITNVSKYNKSYVSDLWRNIVSGNSVTLTSITMGEERDDIEDES